jgi:hypothetical protein
VRGTVQAGALRAGESLAAAEAVEIDTHLRIFRQILNGRDACGVVEQKRDAFVARNRERLFQPFSKRGGVHHGGAFVERGLLFVVGACEDEFSAREPDGVVKRAAPAEHDHFVLEAGRVGKLPDPRGVGAGDAARGGCGHGARCAGGDHA